MRLPPRKLPVVRLARLGPSRGLAPREGLECLLVKMGRTGPLVEPRRGPQAGKSGDPRSQDADSGSIVISKVFSVDGVTLFFMVEDGHVDELRSEGQACILRVRFLLGFLSFLRFFLEIHFLPNESASSAGGAFLL